MAGMKRFVTYIYSYEEKKKGGNTGFARIEIRGGEGRIEIHVREAYPKKANCRIYFFAEEQGDIVGLPLGEMSLRNGAGDFSAIFQVENLGGMSADFYDMEGIILLGEAQQILMSRWKEGNPLEVCRERFRVWDTAESREIPAAVKQEATQETGAGRETGQKQEATQTAAAGRETAKKQEAPQETGTGRETAAKQEAQQTAAAGRETAAEQEAPQETAKGREISPRELEKTEEETIAATEVPMRNVFSRCDWQEIWEHLKENHEHFILYREQEICCVKIELKDIRELPRRYWYLGNNSFLLHGFFNYHYLVVGNVGGGQWFIGIPGIYQNQERVMAAIFGFPEFLPEPIENRFGYWCRFIEES